MARPIKEGLDYFPLDVDIDQDDKVAIIEAQYGIVGFGIVIKLLMHIYKNGYYYQWTEKEQLLFARRVNVDIKDVGAVIGDCLRWGMFDESTFGEYQVLTSKGIQKRYFEATKRRTRVEVAQELLLLSKDDIKDYTNLVIVNINSVDADIYLQSKVKESKEEKRIHIVEQDGPARRDVSPAYEDIVDYLNAKAGKNYKHTTKATQEKIRARMAEGFGLDDFKTVIDNKVRHWKGDPSNDRYLRPETLFGPKFESYLQENPNLKPTQKKRANDFTMSAESERELEEQIKEREMLSKMTFMEQNEYFRQKQEAANGR